MHVWHIKFLGFILWSALLFIPLIAKADEGFDIMIPFSFAETTEESHSDAGIPEHGFSYNQFNDYTPTDGWSLSFNAGKDSVLKKEFSEQVSHDRLDLDDGHRESLLFTIGFKYIFQ